MSPRFVRLCLLVAAFVSGAFAQTPLPGANAPAQPTSPNPAAAQPPAAAVAPGAQTLASIPPAPPEDELVSLVLPDGDIDTVLTALENLTGRVVLRPAQLQTASYNLKIKNKIPKSEAILAIETVLAMNLVGVSPLGEKFLKVVNLQNVRNEAPTMISGSAFELPASGRIATKLFQLEFLRVPEFTPLLQGMLNPMTGGAVQLPNANAVLITDSISNLQRVEVLLQQLDRPVTAGMKPEFFTLKNGAKASDVVNKLRTILGTPAMQQQLGQATTYSADDRTNQIIVITDPRQLDFFAKLIEKLDQRSDPNTRTEVLYLKHAKAEDVVKVLTNIILGQNSAMQKASPGSVRPGTLGQPTPQQPMAPGAQPQPQQPQILSANAAGNPNLDLMSANEFSALMTVVNDPRSNAVVAFGTTDDIRLVRDLVDKLDIVLAQVRIEVVIAEVTLDDNHQSGISALGLKIDGDKLIGFSGSGDGVSISNGTITRPGTGGGFDLAAEISINTTPRKSDTTILSVPAIVTSHGKESTFFAGEQRPIVSGTVTSAGGVTASGLGVSSQYQLTKIGTNLKVTPFIGIDNSVQLDIKQSVEDVVSTVKVDQNEVPVIGSRETNVYVTAKSGEIIVLGGFQKKIDLKTTNRLGPIPILGDIFGSRRRDKYRQELVFFLRPVVLTNNSTVDNAETMRRIEQLPTRDAIKQQIDPNYVPPKQPLLDRILPK